MAICEILFARGADINVLLQPFLSPILPPLHITIVRIVLAKPFESMSQLDDVHSEWRFPARLAGKVARAHFDERHVGWKGRQLRQELSDLLMEVAHMTDVRQLASLGYRVHLHQRMHQCE